MLLFAICENYVVGHLFHRIYLIEELYKSYFWYEFRQTGYKYI
jgi:hypothetical protein